MRKLISFLIIVEMIIGPMTLSYAQTPQDQTRKEKRKQKRAERRKNRQENGSDFNQKASRAMNTIQQVGQMMSMFQQQMQQQQNQRMAQQQIQADGNYIRIAPMPLEMGALGVAKNKCFIPPADPQYIPDLCDPKDFNIALFESGYYDAMYEITYKNFREYDLQKITAHNTEEKTGMMCLQTAMNKEEKYLNDFINEINLLVQAWTRDQEKLSTQLEKIERDFIFIYSMIYGLQPQMQKEKFRLNRNDFKQFRACMTWETKKSFFQNFEKDGLQGLFQRKEEEGASGNYTQFPTNDSMMQKDASKVLRNLSNLRIIKNDFALDDGAKTDLTVGTIVLKEDNPVLDRAINEAKNVQMVKWKDLKQRFSNITDDSDSEYTSMLEEIGINVEDFTTQVKNKAEQSKLKCFNANTNEIIAKAKDERAQMTQSKAPTALKGLIGNVLSLKQLKDKVGTISGVDKLTVRLDKEFFVHDHLTGAVVQEFGARMPIPVMALINVFVNYCEEEFKLKPNTKGASKDKVVKELLKMQRSYHEMRKQFIQGIAQNINQFFTKCKHDPITGKKENSCTSQHLDITSNLYCSATSNQCLVNHNECFDNTKKFIELKEAELDKVADTHHKMVEDYRLKLEKMTKEYVASYKELESLINQSNLWAKDSRSKNEEKYDFSYRLEDKELMMPAPFDTHLMKDSKKVLERYIKNIEAYKKAFQGFAQGYLKELQTYVSNLQKNYSREAGEWKAFAEKCKGMRQVAQDYYKAQAEQKKKQCDDMKKEIFKDDPCKDQFSRLAGDVASITAGMGANIDIDNSTCDELSEKPNLDMDLDTMLKTRPKVCDKPADLEIAAACKGWERECQTGGTSTGSATLPYCNDWLAQTNNFADECIATLQRLINDQANSGIPSVDDKVTYCVTNNQDVYKIENNNNNNSCNELNAATDAAKELCKSEDTITQGKVGKALAEALSNATNNKKCDSWRTASTTSSTTTYQDKCLSVTKELTKLEEKGRKAYLALQFQKDNLALVQAACNNSPPGMAGKIPQAAGTIMNMFGAGNNNNVLGN